VVVGDFLLRGRTFPNSPSITILNELPLLRSIEGHDQSPLKWSKESHVKSFAIALVFLTFSLSPLSPVSTAIADVPEVVMQQSWNVCKVSLPTKYGSGCYVGSNLVVSCRHVVQGSVTAKCIFALRDGKTETIVAAVVGWDPQWDISVLKLERAPTIAPGAKLAQCTPSPGEAAYAAGYSDKRLRWLPGKAIKGLKDGEWRISNAANPGDSGGATFNSQGEFVAPLWGMNSKKPYTATQTVASNNESTRAVLRRLFGRRICGPGACPPQNQNQGNPGRRPEDPDWSVPPLEPPPAIELPEFEISEELLESVADKVFEKYGSAMTGVPGVPGGDGQNGSPGRDGAVGLAGRDGAPGATGPAGEVNYDILVEALVQRLLADDDLLAALAPRIQARLDGIRVNNKSPTGEIIDSGVVKLGGELDLQFLKASSK
jgi:hypothetical protein